MTPARLGLHEDGLLGLRVRIGEVIGGYAPNGSFSLQPPHTSEVDFEQDVLSALRIAPRGQLSLLIPLVETYKTAPGIRAAGGGLGDVNLGARYDFVLAREYRYVPGIALLAGVTLPSGRSPTRRSRRSRSTPRASAPSRGTSGSPSSRSGAPGL